MNPTASAIVAGFFVAVTATAQAAPQAIVKPRFSSLEAQKSPNNNACGGFPEDAMTLVMMDGGKKLADLDFCSAYQRSKVKTVTTRRGHTFAVVEAGYGHGTNATINRLIIYRLQSWGLDEVLRFPISWGTGSPRGWFTYKYSVREDQSGGLEISLKGRRAAADDHCCVPPEKTQTIRIDP